MPCELLHCDDVVKFVVKLGWIELVAIEDGATVVEMHMKTCLLCRKCCAYVLMDLKYIVLDIDAIP